MPILLTNEDAARSLDDADPLSGIRDQFHLPSRAEGRPCVYLCSQSLGLLPCAARSAVERELDRWATLGVDGHFQGAPSWYTYQEPLRPPLARLLGAEPGEVVLMNGLTVNLHLMMETFYHPVAGRYKILLDSPPFPSDLYALKSQLARHGLDPDETLLTILPRVGEVTVRKEDIEEFLEARGKEIAVIVWNAVNFLTGQVFDIQHLSSVAHKQGCVVGLDLAHAVGNVPLSLHEWGIDFAVFCTYKYLCGGPGAVAGAYVHAEHARKVHLTRLAGWWGNDPEARFRMQLEPQFQPRADAGGWQISNPPILALAPLHASLALFDSVGLASLRARSQQLTGTFRDLLETLPETSVQVVTPRDPDQRGCQLSLRIPSGGKGLLGRLAAEGVIGDFREPDILRLAPVPLYNTYVDIWRAYEVLKRCLREGPA